MPAWRAYGKKRFETHISIKPELWQRAALESGMLPEISSFDWHQIILVLFPRTSGSAGREAAGRFGRLGGGDDDRLGKEVEPGSPVAGQAQVVMQLVVILHACKLMTQASLQRSPDKMPRSEESFRHRSIHWSDGPETVRPDQKSEWAGFSVRTSGQKHP